LEKAREFARPTDKNVAPKSDIKKALEAYEKLVNEVARARKEILDVTSKELGITLSATADRNPELEAPLKEKRKIAIEIGTQLSMIAKMTSNEQASAAVTEFLSENPLPAIGRDQTRTFGNDGKATPKYRVTVEIKKGDAVLLSEDGFTKTALALTKPTFGYERGKSLKSEDLRKAWEAAGNTSEKTVKSPVEFEDNGLTFVITKK
jgi:O6-methylguanine-DNA--protein-cysteine methyltransferase